MSERKEVSTKNFVIGKSKAEWGKIPTSDIKELVKKDCWISLKQYFDGSKNGTEAKIATMVIGTLAREKQADNNARQLDLLEKRFEINGGLNKMLSK